MYYIGIEIEGKTNNGGSYQFWLSMLKALSQLNSQKYHISVYSSDIKWVQIAKSMSLNVIHLNQTRSWFNKRIYNNYWTFRYLPLIGRLLSVLYKYFDCNVRIIRKNTPDFWISQVVDGVSDVLKIPAMVPVFDLMHRYEPNFSEVSNEFKLREKLYKHQCQKARILLADSEVGKEQIIESYHSERTNLADHISVLPFIPPDYVYHNNNLSKISYKIYDKYFFYPAQFWTHKNHKNLILAMSKLKNQGTSVNLVLVGTEQNNQKEIINLIKEQNLESMVSILGYVSNEEMVYLYRHARALIMPTFFGPTNIPQLEAFELGCPVATSNIYGIPEQVGDAALLFNPLSVDEIAECMKRLWTDDILCKELVQKGKIKASTNNEDSFNKTLGKIMEHFVTEK